MAARFEQLDAYSQAFGRWRDERAATEPAAVTARREAAFGRFRAEGFPTRKDEDWKYTALAEATARVAVPGPAEAGWVPALEGLPAPDAGALRLVFVNGWFSSESGSRGHLPSGVRLGSLAKALREGDPDWVGDWLGRVEERPGKGFPALNQAFFTDGCLLEVPAGLELEVPIELVFVNVPRRDGLAAAACPRSLIRLGAGARVRLTEIHAGRPNARSLTNRTTEIDLAAGARLQYQRLIMEPAGQLHLGTVCASLADGAGLQSLVFALGGRLVRETLQVTLHGRRADTVLSGLSLARDHSHLDHQVEVRHLGPAGHSEQLYKAVAEDHGRAIYSGRVQVAEAAAGTRARQTGRGLLLSPEAEVDARPHLEIHTDDVECAHGCTLGPVAGEALFYLRSRGLSEEEAVRLLVRAFVTEVVQQAQPAALREFIEGRLPGAGS